VEFQIALKGALKDLRVKALNWQGLKDHFLDIAHGESSDSDSETSTERKVKGTAQATTGRGGSGHAAQMQALENSRQIALLTEQMAQLGRALATQHGGLRGGAPGGGGGGGRQRGNGGGGGGRGGAGNGGGGGGRKRDNECWNWKETGACRFGDKCRFDHNQN